MTTKGINVLIGFILSSVGVAIITRMVGTWVQIGFLFAPKALIPDLNKLNPFA